MNMWQKQEMQSSIWKEDVGKNSRNVWSSMPRKEKCLFQNLVHLFFLKNMMFGKERNFTKDLPLMDGLEL